MNHTPDCLAEDDDGERKGPAITFAGAIDELVRLSGDLSEVAGLFDNAMPETSEARPTIDRMTPHQFFVALLDLRRMRARRFHDETAPAECKIVLQLMLARVDKREMTLSELADASSSPRAATQDRVEQLIDAKLAERFENIADHRNFRVALSTEAALRLAELYRARTRG